MWLLDAASSSCFLHLVTQQHVVMAAGPALLHQRAYQAAAQWVVSCAFGFAAVESADCFVAVAVHSVDAARWHLCLNICHMSLAVHARVCAWLQPCSWLRVHVSGYAFHLLSIYIECTSNYSSFADTRTAQHVVLL
jgi:hypothetical protein